MTEASIAYQICRYSYSPSGRARSSTRR